MKNNGLKQVAAAAGVSISTASRALHGNRRISEPVRKRIIEVAEKAGYVPQPGREHTIALVVSQIGGHGYYGDLLEAVQHAAYRRKYRLELILPDAVDLFFERFYYGVVCVGLTEQNLKTIAGLTARPIAVFNRVPEPVANMFSVISDDEEVMNWIFNRFAGKGERRIALLLAGDPVGNFNNVHRVEGYRGECRKRNWEYLEEIVPIEPDAVEAALLRIAAKQIDFLIYIVPPLLLNVERFILQHGCSFPLVSWEYFISGKANHPVVRQNASAMAETAFAGIENSTQNQSYSRMISVPYLLG